MISGVVYLLRIFKMFHGLMNNPVYTDLSVVSLYLLSVTGNQYELPKLRLANYDVIPQEPQW